MAVLAVLMIASPAEARADADDAGRGASGRGAAGRPVHQQPPNETFPAAPKSSTGCTFPAVAGPNGLVIKHVAPCGSTSGTRTAASPWRTVAQAMSSLNPGEVGYLHDDPNLALDYQESNLRPGKDGTGATGRIRLMAAPGERPWIGRSPSA